MLIYVSHPYGGLFSNKEKIMKVIDELSKKDPKNAYICPVLLYDRLYFDEPYEIGIHRCLEIEKYCSKVIMCEGWQQSEGCNDEFNFAVLKGIPVDYYED